MVDYLAKSLISLSVIPKICFDNHASGIIVKKLKLDKTLIFFIITIPKIGDLGILNNVF